MNARTAESESDAQYILIKLFVAAATLWNLTKNNYQAERKKRGDLPAETYRHTALPSHASSYMAHFDMMN
jgi:hypothetical protein